MGLLSTRDAEVRASPTVAMASLALTLQAEGRDIIALAAGEPDFDTPAHVCAAAKAAIDAGHTRYTPVDGIAPLKDAVRAKFRDENGIDYGPDEVTVTSRSSPVSQS